MGTHHTPACCSCRRVRPGFSLIELLVVISIIAVLVGLLLPALRGARESALDTQCKAHLRQVSAAQFAYQNDFGAYARLWSGDEGDGEAENNPVSPLADYLQIDRTLLPEPESVMQCPAVEPTEYARLAPLVQPGQQVSSLGTNPAMQMQRWEYDDAVPTPSDLILVGEQAVEPFEQLPTSDGVTSVRLAYGGVAWVPLNDHDPQRGYRHVPGGANFAMHDGSARRLFHDELELTGKHWAWWDPYQDPWTLAPLTSEGAPGGCGCGE